MPSPPPTLDNEAGCPLLLLCPLMSIRFASDMRPAAITVSAPFRSERRLYTASPEGVLAIAATARETVVWSAALHAGDESPSRPRRCCARSFARKSGRNTMPVKGPQKQAPFPFRNVNETRVRPPVEFENFMSRGATCRRSPTRAARYHAICKSTDADGLFTLLRREAKCAMLLASSPMTSLSPAPRRAPSRTSGWVGRVLRFP